MVKFLDGTAAGVELELRRAPLMLRIVRDENGTFDALDQLDDSPKETESIVVYIQTPGSWSRYHVRRSPRSKSGYYEAATYVAFHTQPEDWQIRTTDNWRSWCMANDKELRALHETLTPPTN